jgi:endonuclease-3
MPAKHFCIFQGFESYAHKNCGPGQCDHELTNRLSVFPARPHRVISRHCHALAYPLTSGLMKPLNRSSFGRCPGRSRDLILYLPPEARSPKPVASFTIFACMTRKQKFEYFIEYFSANMPDAATELEYGTPYELLVAVILSAQCTDRRVNMITPDFFKSFPTAEILASAAQDHVYELIKSCSYPNNKARNLIGMARVLTESFGGVVPSDVEELQKMPGVGRKTANVIASVVYRKPAMAVDTHVFRVSARIGLTSNAKTPLAAEKQLVKYIPADLIHLAHHWLILHGRYTCLARKPRCGACGLSEICDYFKKNQP